MSDRTRYLIDWAISLMTIAVIMAMLTCVAFGGESVSDGQRVSADGERPDWCKTGYVCLPTPVAGQLAEKVTFLEEQVSILKARRSGKWGLVAGCGPSASLQVNDGNTTLAGTLSCTIGYGFRF